MFFYQRIHKIFKNPIVFKKYILESTSNKIGDFNLFRMIQNNFLEISSYLNTGLFNHMISIGSLDLFVGEWVVEDLDGEHHNQREDGSAREVGHMNTKLLCTNTSNYTFELKNSK